MIERDTDHIRRVRRFNRAFSQRIGALNDSYLDRGRPLGEARMLYEIGPEGADVRDLRARLGLDSGYASRLLRSLERQGMVEAAPSTEDGRVRRMTLTEAGRAEVAELDRLSDAYAESVLAPLGSALRDRLVAAMDEVERLMRASVVQIGPEAAGGAGAIHCLEGYYGELAQRFDAGYDPAKGVSVKPEDFTPPAGVFLVARLEGRPVGCGGLRLKGDPGVGEIKRVWVAPEARGLGLGRRLIEALEAQARGFGLAVLRLDTNRTLTEARAMYGRCGYAEIGRFNDEIYADHWFEKRL